MLGWLKFPMKKFADLWSANEKETYIVTRAWEEGDNPIERYVAKFQYEDGSFRFEMNLTPEEADIYQNAHTQYEKRLKANQDSMTVQHWKAQKFLSLHDHFGEQIRKYYSIRLKTPVAWNRAKEYCRLQIHYAPVAIRAYRDDPFAEGLPEHQGYTYLARMMEEDGQYKQALDLVHAGWNEGWKGDWALWAARLRKKIDSAGKASE
ncbi:hypothetical protein GCM10011571_23000 [Marinithermofilum abyssi]|uniref:Uncharacterized protein n=1 Tax=Marinithermofilum abyssi TaxID=1571185 RepID=A0A8J2VI46_9BACL|nr:hypothetical protein [Marinithermofilum abyssi]GGE20425.1 hypothetical protein GCM10011571_23000 [Marinithermofilum abyssi]